MIHFRLRGEKEILYKSIKYDLGHPYLKNDISGKIQKIIVKKSRQENKKKKKTKKVANGSLELYVHGIKRFKNDNNNTSLLCPTLSYSVVTLHNEMRHQPIFRYST